jgi:hypothetical protein
MARFIYEFEGVRGRNLKLYDTKVVVTTNVTVGSIITGNVTDGEKTIFLSDVVGVQFKRSGALIGYLQFETPSMQMNNKGDNMFSENTFTFENNKNEITNELMEKVYAYVVDRVEELKYGTILTSEIPDFDAEKARIAEEKRKEAEAYRASVSNTTLPAAEEQPEGEKCELCGGYFEKLTHCQIKDDFGTRFRNICDDCMTKHNAKPKR